MTPPSLGLFSSSTEVCEIKRSLYGVRQAPRAWFEKFLSTLLGFSFTHSHFDSSLFIHQTSVGIVLFLIYVDYIVTIGSDQASIHQLKNKLQASFQMKDLGCLNYLLGLEVHSNTQGIFLHQHKYTDDLIYMVVLQQAVLVDTLLEVNAKYHCDKGDLMPDPLVYLQLVGSFNYLTVTHPKISFFVQHVSQFMHAHRHLHMAGYLSQGYLLSCSYVTQIACILQIRLIVQILEDLSPIGACFLIML